MYLLPMSAHFLLPLSQQFYAGMDRDLTEREERIIEQVATSEVRNV